MIKYLKYWLCALLCILSVGFCSASAQAASGLEVHFLKVGRNDGILIRCGDDDVFIDAGMYQQGVEAVEYMQALGIDKLTYYIGTHMHEDHIGGAPHIVDTFRPQAIILTDGEVDKMLQSYARTRQEREALAQTPRIFAEVGQQIRVGDAVLTVLGPVNIRKVRYEDQNINSLILRLSYGDTDILLTADGMTPEFEEILAKNPDCLQADVMKNAHHGADMDAHIVAAVSPEYIIFSTDPSSTPTYDMMDMLHETGAILLSTSYDHCGRIILRTDGKTIDFETEKKASSLTLNYSQAELYSGEHISLGASLKPSGRRKMLTYVSSDPTVAEVSRSGRVTAKSAGEAIIRVHEGSGLYAECAVTVKPSELKFRKTSLTVTHGSKGSADYSVLPKGSKPLIFWTSADESIATVDSKGRVTGIYPGQTVIRAEVENGAVSEIPVTVTPIEVKSVSIKPSSVSMTIGDSRSVSASVSPSNATWKDVAWSSADESILTVNADGQITAVGVGKTKLTATSVNGKSKTISVTVKPVYVKKIVPASETAELIRGMAGYDRMQLTYGIEPANATIQNVIWKSSNPKVVTVDENGMITALKDGSATITCTAADGSGRYARIKVNVELPTERIELKKAALSLHEGKTAYIDAVIYPKSRTKQLTYTSLNEEVASVSSSGKITGMKSGVAVIRVSERTGIFADCVVTVSPATMKIRKSEMTLTDGKSSSVSYSVEPSGAKPVIAWASKDESIATVDKNGKITAQYPGSTVITATMPSGQVGEVAVTVTPVKASGVSIKPSSVSMTIGESCSVKASVSPSNATWQEITWHSENTDIVTVSADGTLRAVGVGQTKITAATPEGKTRSATVMVKPVYVKKIVLAKPDIELVGGVSGRNQIQLSHKIEPSDATIQNVVWSTSDKKTAVVDENGMVTGLRAGSVYITCKATDGSGRYTKLKVTFKENELSRSVQAVPGKLTVQPERIRYKDSGRTLEIRLAFKNRSGITQKIPSHGLLTLITPEGEQIILKQLNGAQETLKDGRSAAVTYKIPVSTHPKLIGLDLSRCDVVILTAQQAFADRAE